MGIYISECEPNKRETIINDLIDLANHQYPQVRATVAKALGHYRTPHPKIRMTLIKLLVDKAESVRDDATRSYLNAYPTEAAPGTFELLKKGDAALRDSVLNSIGIVENISEFHQWHKILIEFLASRLQDSKDTGELAWVLKCIEKMKPHDLTTQNSVFPLIKHSDSKIREACCRALSVMFTDLSDPEGSNLQVFLRFLPDLEKLLKDPTFRIRIAAGNLLYTIFEDKFKADFHKLLTEGIKKDNLMESELCDVLRAFGVLESRHPNDLLFMRNCAKHKNDNVKKLALEMLGKLGYQDLGTIAFLINELKNTLERDVDILHNALKSIMEKINIATLLKLDDEQFLVLLNRAEDPTYTVLKKIWAPR